MRPPRRIAVGHSTYYLFYLCVYFLVSGHPGVGVEVLELNWGMMSPWRPHSPRLPNCGTAPWLGTCLPWAANQLKRLEPSHFSKWRYTGSLGGALIWLKGFDPNGARRLENIPGDNNVAARVSSLRSSRWFHSPPLPSMALPRDLGLVCHGRQIN